jgi:arylsulfatase A-like enzyme
MAALEDTGFPMPHQPATTSFTPEDHLRSRRYYAAMIENIDPQVGRFLDLVRLRGEEENTLLVFSSDHGEMLGDHGKWGKGIWRDIGGEVVELGFGCVA